MADWKLAGYEITEGAALTPEMIEEGARLMLEHLPVPCGTKEHPHLISPRGGYCVNCGDGPFGALLVTAPGAQAVIRLDK